MPEDVELGRYGLAYACGGPERVAMVALVDLCEDGWIKIAPARHRVTVLRRADRDPVQAAALDLIPGTGRPLGQVMATLARSGAVEEVGRAVADQGLPRPKARWPWRRRHTGQGLGRRLAGRLPTEPGDPRRVAVLGRPTAAHCIVVWAAPETAKAGAERDVMAWPVVGEAGGRVA